MKALTHGRYRGLEGRFAVFDLEHGAAMRVAILEPDLGRLVLRRAEGPRLDRGWSIAPNRTEPPYEGRARDDLSGFSCPEPIVTEAEGVVTVAAAGLTARVRLDPFGIDWHRAGEAAPFLSDRPTQAYFLSRRTGALRHAMVRDPAERHYGLGDKAGPLDRTGRRFRIDAVDPCGFDAALSDPLYKMLPFLLVDGPAGAHGVFYDNLAVGEVDCGATLDNYHGLFRSYAAEDGDLDAYVFAGPRVADVVRRFSWATGGQAFPPLWSLGFGCTSMTIPDSADADARLTDFIARCREHDIPCDSFHIGSGYTSIGPRRYAFNWNREKFPDPSATMARMRDAGLRMVANLKPCLLDDHPRLAEAQDGDFLVRDGETGKPAVAQFWDGLGFHLDFTNAKGRAWWRAGIETALLDYGIGAVWNDNNEYEIWDEDALCAGDGRPFAQSLARAAQALLMTKLSHETQAARAPGIRPYAITRAGPAGLARYGQTWTGDNETAWKTLRYNLTQGLGMSLSGLFNTGHDVGGFHGPSPGPELFCRFVEFCALWPRFVMNSWKDDRVVNLPWMHPEVLPQVRDVMNLRVRLMPYLYTRMWRAALADEPVVRPLFHDFPGDATVLAVEDAFMLGPDLLVAPVLEEGARTRTVALPQHPGGWFDWYSGEAHAGGTTVTVKAPLGRLPLLVRAGAMIPVADGAARGLQVFGLPEARAEAWLYEDDGETARWRDGDGLALRLLLEDGRVGVAEREGTHHPAWERIGVRQAARGGPVIDVAAGSETTLLTAG